MVTCFLELQDELWYSLTHISLGLYTSRANFIIENGNNLSDILTKRCNLIFLVRIALFRIAQMPAAESKPADVIPCDQHNCRDSRDVLHNL